jgi:hypothetical protein
MHPKVERREMQVYDVPQTVSLIEAVSGKRVFISRVAGRDVRASPWRDCRPAVAQRERAFSRTASPMNG